ncbi:MULTISPECIES: cytochrome P450 [Nocardiaceae]|jgi:cytochrome P450|uniref:cytochrome P450 n=1 Tax=Nocardiaceae TaxID=85025 RepID=UPI00050C5A8C|nr:MULTISPECIES: cytochrome P450 [Rhodococcus]OZD71147.1 cytochrome P450 [Rhodococcus sp. 05-340-2]OZD74046.1 cytochrome P450 [Rhodococcus sp. 05-340-1]OZE99734.1 cytochrome P450 [Rhodococcus sp. 15-2388-1-1a]OZF37044.1 cytochrome P450 [Rhodococcus sp. 14-2483-1-2]
MTSVVESPRRSYDPLSVSHLGFWASTADEREKTFSVLRRERPISWHPPLEGGLMPPENDGVWVCTSHELIAEVSKHPELFCSGQGFQFEEVPDDILEAAGSFLGMDSPRHGALRKLVSAAFTPKQVSKIHDQIKRQAASIVDDVLQTPSGDFVTQVSKRLPMWTIYEMMGLDDEDKRNEAAHHADGMVSWADEDVAAGREPGEVLNDALVSLLMLGMDLAAERRAHPRSDLMTNLVNAEVDGKKLTDEEIGSFFVLLSVAGNDTTRNTISLTQRALQLNPDQRDFLLGDFDGRIGTAIEEFVRYNSPVMTFRRTATQDTVLGGENIRAGDWVAMIYSSGNRDEKVFDRPDLFDLSRNPNPHQGFGGGGPHFCMGNFVAKMQLREIFDQLLHRAPGLTVGEPTYLAGNFVHAVKSLPYSL